MGEILCIFTEKDMGEGKSKSRGGNRFTVFNIFMSV